MYPGTGPGNVYTICVQAGLLFLLEGRSVTIRMDANLRRSVPSKNLNQKVTTQSFF